MGHRELATHATIVAETAREASEELDAVREHPQVIGALRALADDDSVLEALDGSLGDDPAGYLRGVADDLEPFRHELMHDEPELVERLLFAAAATQRAAAAIPA